MAFGQTRVAPFFEYLKANAIPVVGIAPLVSDAPAGVTIQLDPAATAEQIAWANNARDTFDWRRRRSLSRNDIVTALQNLTTQQQNSVLRHVVCYLLRQNPQEAANVMAVIGTSLPVDEVDPTEVPPS